MEDKENPAFSEFYKHINTISTGNDSLNTLKTMWDNHLPSKKEFEALKERVRDLENYIEYLMTKLVNI